MSWTAEDHQFMARAMKLARQGIFTSHPNPRVGCVLVKDRQIIGEGSHLQTGKEHAEINAIKRAGKNVRGATCYVTLEPCVHMGRTPPCTDGLINAGISKVIASIVDPNPVVNGKGLKKLKEHGIETLTGLLESEASELNKGYIKRRYKGLPYVRCKMAVSADGRTALASGESKWITGPQARTDVQTLRAESSAILTGIGTILADDPKLTVRDMDLMGRHPVRVIIDRKLKIPDSAEIFQHPGNIIIFTETEDIDKSRHLINKDVDIVLIKDKENFLQECMQLLANEYQINDLLVESGAILAGALLKQGLIDEFIVYQAPTILGDKGAGMINIDSIENMASKINLMLKDVRHIGNDIRLHYSVQSNQKGS